VSAIPDSVKRKLPLIRVPGRPIVYRELGLLYRGRLGNQLWQIAGTLGIAARLGKVARFPDWGYRPYFSIPDRHFRRGLLAGADATSVARHLSEEERPYLQDAGLWRSIQATIREYLGPSQRTRAELDAQFADFLALPAKTAVHIRRGDHLHQPRHHPMPSQRYLRRALELVPTENVVVFSDDIAWCEANLQWLEPIVFMSGNRDFEDLFLMARCDNHIIANSSFSWWGAFLSGDPNPIYPARWYGTDLSHVDSSLMFPDGWIGIDG
jgi:hypothetical protein